MRSDPNSAAAYRMRRRQYFERRSRDAREGNHLPTLPELIRGAPFLRGDISVDAGIFAERVLHRIKSDSTEATVLRNGLKEFSILPELVQFQAVADAFRAMLNVADFSGPNLISCALRSDYYAACEGCVSSAWRIAGHAAHLAQHGRNDDDDEAVDFATAAVGWMLVGSGKRPSSRQSPWPIDNPEIDVRERADDLGQRMVFRILETRRRIQRQEEEARATEAQDPGRDDTFAPIMPADDGGDQIDPAMGTENHGVVVLTSIGNPQTTEGKNVLKRFAQLLNASVPLIELPDLILIRRELTDEFPYAASVISALLDELAGQPHVRFRPFVLVGLPGSGKTTFAERLLDVLGVPGVTYSCGGVADASLAGTPRRWATGEPSLPISMISQHHVASPGIVLDEVEKVGTGRLNGSLLDALLGLLEPRTSVRWHEPYLEAAVNLSNVVWIATANSLEGIAAPLRDRLRILHFPQPSLEHLPTLTARLMTKAAVNRSLDPRWALPPDGIELAALARVWQGGSVRKLARLVDAVVAARDRHQGYH